MLQLFFSAFYFKSNFQFIFKRINEDKNHSFMYPERPIETTVRKERPPFNIKIFKGEREIALTRYARTLRRTLKEVKQSLL